jgi:glycosyltransferase 2 family protein
MRWKRAGKLLLKIVFSVGILSYLFSKISLISFWESFLNARHNYIILAFVLYIIGQTICAYKWELLAKTLGFRRRFKRFLAYYFIGMFFNLFFLGSIGGDVGKAYLLAGKEDSRMRAGYSILADRFTGGMALITIAIIALISSPTIHVLPLLFKLMQWVGLDGGVFSASKHVISLWLRIGLVGACIVVWALVLTFPLFLPLFPWLTRWAAKIKLGDFAVYWSHPGRMSLVLAISFCFQIINILVYALLGMALNLGIPLGDYFVIVPLVDLISILPISISGIGVREGSYVGLLYLLGVETSRGLAFGLLGFLVVMAASLLGGIIYVFGNYPLKLRRRKESLTPSSKHSPLARER